MVAGTLLNPSTRESETGRSEFEDGRDYIDLSRGKKRFLDTIKHCINFEDKETMTVRSYIRCLGSQD